MGWVFYENIDLGAALNLSSTEAYTPRCISVCCCVDWVMLASGSQCSPMSAVITITYISWGRAGGILTGNSLYAELCGKRSIPLVLLQWCHNEHNDVSNQQCLECFLNHLFRHQSKKPWKLHITGHCEGNPPVTGGFPSQRASNSKYVSIWWHHDFVWLINIGPI